jgi:DNA-binding response OmpR family regulator
MSDIKTQLGKILLKRKLVDSSQLDSILDEQRLDPEHHERLASRVLEKGLTDEIGLLRALSEQAGVPAINLDDVVIDLSILDVLPHDIAAQHGILPVGMDGDSINLAMANPGEQKVIDEIEFVTGKKIFSHVALHGQIVRVIEEAYRAREAGESRYCGKHATALTRGTMDSVAGVVSGGWEGQAEPGAGSSREETGIEVEIEIPFDGPMPEAPVREPQPLRGAATAPAPPAAGTPAVRGPRKKVLVVDDEDDIRLLISRVLTEKGYQVVTAGRGLEAIQKVQTENPDMIILDAMLPEVHGFDICKKIKGSRKYGHIPVIMISAIYRGWRYAQDLKDSYGVDDFIEKPFKIGEFLKKVESNFAALEAGAPPAPEPDLSGEAERILARSVEVYRAGDIDKAMELLRSGLEIDPLSFKLHYNLGLLLGKKALNYQAIRELESALELAPDFFPAIKNLALLYQKTGFKFKAIETWERALQHSPDDETRDGIKHHLMSLL